MKTIDERWKRYCEELDALDLESMDWLNSPVIKRTITSPLEKNTELHKKEAKQVQAAFGNIKDLKIIEIGGGYGNACRVFQQKFDIKEYTMVDTPHMVRLANRFFEEHNVQCQLIDCYHIDKLFDKSYDLFFSATCLSELPLDYRNRIVKNIWPNCKRLFITNADQRAHPDLDNGKWDEWLQKSIEAHFDKVESKPMPKEMSYGKQPFHWIHIGWKEK